MQTSRIDDLSRSIAMVGTRRAALRALGVSGLAAALLSAFGWRTSAQNGPVTCVLDFHAETATDPGEDEEYDGELTLVIQSDGVIDGGELEINDESFDAVGQALGRALTLRITLNDDQALSLHGVGEQDITDCRGIVEGTFGGPEMLDLGTWKATATGQQGASGGSTGSGGSNGSPVAGPSPTPCPPILCEQPFVVDQHTCQCDCPEPYDRCGGVCCFGGAVCHNEDTGECSCPEGEEACQEVCMPMCGGGQVLNPDSCECEEPGCPPGESKCGDHCVDLMTDDAACGNCETSCALNSGCVNGTCVSCASEGGICTDNSHCCTGFCEIVDQVLSCGHCDQTICGVDSCSDLNNDEANCGACGNACPAGVSCIGGSCQCPPGYVACTGGCKIITSDEANCGGCGVACGTNQNCVDGHCECFPGYVVCDGTCSSLTTVQHCGGCGIGCLVAVLNGSIYARQLCVSGSCCGGGLFPCASDAECCSNVCIASAAGNYCA